MPLASLLIGPEGASNCVEAVASFQNEVSVGNLQVECRKFETDIKNEVDELSMIKNKCASLKRNDLDDWQEQTDPSLLVEEMQ